MLKQENERLKGTIRLLENDKAMMKAYHSKQLKNIQRLEKKIDDLTSLKEEKDNKMNELMEENSNLLFKKNEQMQFESKLREKQEIKELNMLIAEIKTEKKKIEEEN